MRPIVSLWQKAPFIRLFLCQVSGILIQWHIHISFIALLVTFITCFSIAVIYSFLPLAQGYHFKVLNGLFLQILTMCVAAIQIWIHLDKINNPVPRLNRDYNVFKVTISEPPVEKGRSFKAIARIDSAYGDKKVICCSEKMILYFKKEPGFQMVYGTQLIFRKPLQEIGNNGNPGGFNYRQYCLFRGISVQAYLTVNEYRLLPGLNKKTYTSFVITLRNKIVSILKKFINGEKEQGLAEALLIGYQDDLDKDLVRAYTNTGVVHVVAISGLHLGLVYVILLFISRPIKKWVFIRFVLILSGLWLFSIVAGAQPSVLRSALMFSFIAMSEILKRKTNMFNSLAMSAFILLCINPFWLWDIGFQLSYSAVLSILLFYKPVSNWIIFSNKIPAFTWQLMSVSIAAQLLTLPLSIYHFHQAPCLFLLTNLVAVPLSGIILFGEILLCSVFFIEPAALLLGVCIKSLIWFMNTCIERFADVSFAQWKDLSINTVQAISLTIFIMCFCYWLIENKKSLLVTALLNLLIMVAFRSWSFMQSAIHHKIIVYNIPRYTAIDIITGRRCLFLGDSTLIQNYDLRSFYLQPSRILSRIQIQDYKPLSSRKLQFFDKHILILDGIPEDSTVIKGTDLLILCGHRAPDPGELKEIKNLHQVVLDPGVPYRKAQQWESECLKKKIPCHNITKKGAFEMNL